MERPESKLTIKLVKNCYHRGGAWSTEEKAETQTREGGYLWVHRDSFQRSGLCVKCEGCGKDITVRSSVCKNLET